MALVLKDRVAETSITVGTGSLTLLGAIDGFQSFSAIGNGNTTYYTVKARGSADWETGLGTYSGGALSRDVVFESSTGSKVDFGGCIKDVFISMPASKTLSVAGSGLSISGNTITNTAPDQTVELTAGSNVTITGTYPSFTIASTATGNVTSVTGTSPIASTGGATPAISIPKATNAVDGYLSATDWTAFNNKGNGTVTSVTATSPVTSTGGATPVIAMPAATTSVNGYLTSTDWNTFNGKGQVNAITSTDGSVTISGTSTVDLSVAVAGSTNTVLCPVRNTTGATLTKGTVVYINGAVGQISTVAKALATSDATSAQTLGMITADLANNSNGNVTVIGVITNINTSAYTDGQQLYLSPTVAGAVTATKPHAPQHLVYIGVVEHAHPTQGKIFVKVQNGYELDELHDVSAQSPTNGQTLIYNETTDLWEKHNLTAGTGISVTNGAGSITVANSLPMVYPSAGIPNSTGSAWGTSYGVTGTGSVVLSDSPTIAGTALIVNSTNTYINGGFDVGSVGAPVTINGIGTNLGTSGDGDITIGNIYGYSTIINSLSVYATGNLQLTGSATANQNIATTQTTGTLTIGGTSSTGSITLGQSTSGQTVNINNGSSAVTKITNIGRNGTAGTTTVNIGTLSGGLNTITLGGGTGTGTININNTTGTSSTGLSTGVTLSGNTKTINLGTNGASGSTTNINIGSATTGATNNITFNADATINTIKVGKGGGAIATNTAVGFQTLNTNTTGSSNTSIGYQSLNANSTGANNSAIGNFALLVNTTASDNTSVGSNALRSTTIGGGNTAIGSAAMYGNIDGTENTAIGATALNNNSSGARNTAIGSSALYRNTSGVGNVAIGKECMVNNTTGSNLVAIGSYVMGNNTTGGSNVAVGFQTLGINSTGSGNTAMGNSALYNNNTDYNTAIGFNVFGTQTTGSGNTGIGAFAGANTTTGNNNVAVGNNALVNNTTGSSNVGIGVNTFVAVVTGNNNTGVGPSCLNQNTSGSYNVAVGSETLSENRTGNGNIALGEQAGRYSGAGGVTGATNCVFIGNRQQASGVSPTNEVVISGGQSVGLGSNTTVIGNSSTTQAKIFGQVAVGGNTPASATAAGVAGTITWDANYIYVCIATNTWKRMALLTW